MDRGRGLEWAKDPLCHIGSPTVEVLAGEPQTDIEILMENNYERLGVEDCQTEAGTLVLFRPRASENEGESLNAILSRNIGSDYHWDAPTPLNSMPLLKEQILASAWVLRKAKVIQLCWTSIQSFEFRSGDYLG